MAEDRQIGWADIAVGLAAVGTGVLLGMVARSGLQLYVLVAGSVCVAMVTALLQQALP